MDKQKIIVVLLLVTIVLALGSIMVTVGVPTNIVGQKQIITIAEPGHSSAQLIVLPPTSTGGNLS